MATSLDVSMRDLRNHTKTVIEQIEDGATMYLTKNGERIATITPLRPKTWADHVDDVLDGEDAGGTEYHSGMSELLAAADAESTDFDDDHLGIDHLGIDHRGIDHPGSAR